MTVTATGVVVPTEEELLARMQTSIRAAVDPALDLSADSPEGAMLRAIVPELRQAHEGVAEAATSYDPAQAEGAALRSLAAISGLAPFPARATEIAATVNLNSGITLPAGTTRAHVVGHPEVSGALRVAVTSTTSGNYAAIFDLEATGPTPVLAGTFTGILTPIGGWNSVTNAADAALGRNAETDEELRLRMAQSTGRTGRGTVAAVRAGVLALDQVETVTIFENATGATVDTLPPHSYEVLVNDGGDEADNEIAQAIFDATVSGYTPVGVTFGTAVDPDTGAAVTINFSRPAGIAYDVEITLRATSVNEATVKALVVARGSASAPGDDVIPYALGGAVQAALAGDEYVSIARVRVDPAGSWTTSPVTIAPRELATFDTGNVTVIFL